MQEICSSSPFVVTGICDWSKYWARHHYTIKLFFLFSTKILQNPSIFQFVTSLKDEAIEFIEVQLLSKRFLIGKYTSKCLFMCKSLHKPCFHQWQHCLIFVIWVKKRLVIIQDRSSEHPTEIFIMVQVFSNVLVYGTQDVYLNRLGQENFSVVLCRTLQKLI